MHKKLKEKNWYFEGVNAEQSSHSRNLTSTVLQIQQLGMGDGRIPQTKEKRLGFKVRVTEFSVH